VEAAGQRLRAAIPASFAPFQPSSYPRGYELAEKTRPSRGRVDELREGADARRPADHVPSRNVGHEPVVHTEKAEHVAQEPEGISHEIVVQVDAQLLPRERRVVALELEA
jgi:hypothetical protein